MLRSLLAFVIETVSSADIEHTLAKLILSGQLDSMIDIALHLILNFPENNKLFAKVQQARRTHPPLTTGVIDQIRSYKDTTNVLVDINSERGTRQDQSGPEQIHSPAGETITNKRSLRLYTTF